MTSRHEMTASAMPGHLQFPFLHEQELIRYG